MDTVIKKHTRRKFIGWGLASAVVFSTAKFLHPSGKKETVKMLTENGTLVEIDRDRIPGGKKRNITDPELKNWVKNKPAQH